MTRSAYPDCSTLATSLHEQVLAWTREICLIPAPTGREMTRAKHVAALLSQYGLQPTIDKSGNVTAMRPATADTPAAHAQPLRMVSAHLDTVFPAATPLAVTQTDATMTGPGIGDNCLALACLVALAAVLLETQAALPCDVLLVANVAEEGLGNLAGMKEVVGCHRARLETPGSGCIVLEGHGLGRVVHQAVGSSRLRLEVQAQGGHSWADHGRTSAIHALAAVICELNAITLPTQPRTTFNVGLIEGGTSVNTIAQDASAVIDMRSIDAAALANLEAQVRAVVARHHNSTVKMSLADIGQRPAGSLSVTSPLAAKAFAVLGAMGLSPVSDAASTDANVPISMGIDAVCIGLTHGRDAHRTDETIETAPVAQGIEQLLRMVMTD